MDLDIVIHRFLSVKEVYGPIYGYRSLPRGPASTHLTVPLHKLAVIIT